MSAQRAVRLVVIVVTLQLTASFLLNGPSKKKGLSITLYRCGDFEVLKGANWWYDWSNNRKNYTAHCNTQLPSGYVPMVWGWHTDGRNNDHDFGSYDTVLGFNEPNHRSQANLTGPQAAQAWRELEKQAGSRTLVSPAASPCTGSRCYGYTGTWFAEFFKACPDCRVDYLATHYYECTTDHLMSYLEGLWNRFQRKIWLTEFSCHSAKSPEESLAFMKRALPLLEAAPYVYRYAWYTSRIITRPLGYGSILSHDNESLTELGRFYMQF